MGDFREELNRLADVLSETVGSSGADNAVLRQAARDIRALSARAAVPEGFVMVPARPTHAMREAAYKWHTTEYVSDPMGERNRFYGGIYSAMLAAAPQPAGEAVPRNDLVPGVMRCAKCAFQLHRVTLYVRSGTTGAGDSDTEPCPNGCGPLWPVTWRQWAEEAQEYAQRLQGELDALKAEPAPSAPADVEALDWITDDMSGIQIVDQVRIQAQFSRIEDDEIVKALEIALDRLRLSAPAAVKDCLTTAEMEMREDGERFAFLVSRWSNNTGTLRQSTPADDAILNSLTTGDMPAIRLVIDNVRRLSGAQQAAEDFELPIPMGCQCQADVEIGTHANQVELETPEFMRALGRVGCLTFRETTSVDRCVAPLVQALWERGVITTGSCCGHNQRGGYIGIYVAAHAAKDGAE